jgi:hypothetical protein
MAGRHLFGTTITFGTSSFAALIRSITTPEGERIELDTSHMGTAAGGSHTGISWRTKIPSDIGEWKAMRVSILFDPDLKPPIDQAAETITITFPLASGQTNNATLAWTGFMTRYGGEVPYDNVSEGSYEIAISGDVTWTAGS